MFIFNWFKNFFTDFFSTTPGEGVVPISNDYLPLTVVEYVYMGDGTVEAVTMTYEEAQEAGEKKALEIILDKGE